jgi:hypothetical protein
MKKATKIQLTFTKVEGEPVGLYLLLGGEGFEETYRLEDIKDDNDKFNRALEAVASVMRGDDAGAADGCCGHCLGIGHVDDRTKEPCPACGGSGRSK